VTSFDAQYFDGATWQTVPGGSVAGNNLVKRRLTFAPVTTAKIRVVVSGALAGYSRVVEVEAYAGNAAPTPTPTPRVNVALSSGGAVASASSTYSPDYPVGAVNDGDRRGVNWGAGGGWNDATPGAYPDWVEVSFGGPKTITEIDLFTLQDDYGSPMEPTPGMTFSRYGVTDFQLQYWDGAGWAGVAGGAVSGNDKVWRQFTFPGVTTAKIRVLIGNSLSTYSRVVEIEAY
jgi:hypothetical protein